MLALRHDYNKRGCVNRHILFFLSEYYVAKAMLIGMQKINHEKHEAAIKDRHANETKRNMGQVKDGNAKERHEARKDRQAYRSNNNTHCHSVTLGIIKELGRS